MSRTYTNMYAKNRHKNAIPYKRGNKVNKNVYEEEN